MMPLSPEGYAILHFLRLTRSSVISRTSPEYPATLSSAGVVEP